MKIYKYGISTRYISIMLYNQNIYVNKAKHLVFPSTRGTLLPSVDWQRSGGIAINWLWVRIRISKRY